MMSDHQQTSGTATETERRWVAFGPTGVVGSIHQTGDGYSMRLMNDSEYRGTYDTLEVAKSALHAAMAPGSDWPEFREH